LRLRETTAKGRSGEPVAGTWWAKEAPDAMENERTSTIRIRTRIESETITIPELAPFIGKDVEITVRDESSVPREKSVTAPDELREIDFDHEAFWRLREASKI
jgi:hypothetical protein